MNKMERLIKVKNSIEAAMNATDEAFKAVDDALDDTEGNPIKQYIIRVFSGYICRFDNMYDDLSCTLDEINEFIELAKESENDVL